MTRCRVHTLLIVRGCLCVGGTDESSMPSAQQLQLSRTDAASVWHGQTRAACAATGQVQMSLPDGAGMSSECPC